MIQAKLAGLIKIFLALVILHSINCIRENLKKMNQNMMHKISENIQICKNSLLN